MDADKPGDTSGSAEAAAVIAALRRENAMLRETLDAIDGTVVVYDAGLHYRFANRGYHDLFPHLPPDEELAGMHFADVLALSIAAGAVADPEATTDPEGFTARRIAEIQDRSRPVREAQNPRSDTWSLIRVKWTPTDNRVALRVDITELKRLQKELLRAQRMETVGRISGGVAHDFNNLLTVIMSNLELIRLRPADTQRVDRLAGDALQAADAGARLIRQLLTFSRRDMTQPRMLDPSALLSAMEDLLRRTAGPMNSFTLVLDKAGGSAIFDASQFESAIVNLVLNAREAIGATGKPGQITVSTSGNDPRKLAITVSDTGCGMAPEIAAQAFDPFFTTKPVGLGPGLGLSQVYGFVTGSGGEVSINAEVGKGSTITLHLPRVTGA
jgi:signal transduction histidine kinase